MSNNKPLRCKDCPFCTNNWHSSIYDLCGITDKYVSDDDFCKVKEYDKKEQKEIDSYRMV